MKKSGCVLFVFGLVFIAIPCLVVGRVSAQNVADALLPMLRMPPVKESHFVEDCLQTLLPSSDGGVKSHRECTVKEVNRIKPSTAGLSAPGQPTNPNASLKESHFVEECVQTLGPSGQGVKSRRECKVSEVNRVRPTSPSRDAMLSTNGSTW
jgi:hypothetical protein